MTSHRPKHLNLFKIKLPLPGVVSFLHRISGAMLFMAIPLFLFVLQGSLDSAENFEKVRLGFLHPLVKLVLILLAWGFLHHLFAGLRFLAMDMHVGLELDSARRNSQLVMAFSLSLLVLIGAWLW